MRIVTSTIFCICLTLSSPALMQSEGWRGIVPLHSTRADVERTIGAPINNLKNLYDTDKERVLIYYQQERCITGDAKGRRVQGGWNVSPDTVLSIDIAPKSKIQFSALRLDEAKYKKIIHPHDPLTTYYVNEEDNISVSIDSAEGWIKRFSYGPTTKDEKLHCPSTPAPAKDKVDCPPPHN